jgi:hypothetical protein
MRTTTTGSTNFFGFKASLPTLSSTWFIDDKFHLRVHVNINPQP